ncbi:MAG: peptide deformylase, partial [Kaistella sp.]
MKLLCFLFLTVTVFSYGQKFTAAEISLIKSGELHSALPIFQSADSLQRNVLLAKSRDLKPRNKVTKILVNRMKLALIATDGGVGIAAPQVGINRNIIWAQRFDKAEKPLEYFLNPKIIWR